MNVNGILCAQQGSHRFEHYSEINVLAVANATLNATAVICGGGDSPIVIYKYVVHGATSEIHAVETFAVVEAFHGIYAQHGTSELGMKFPEFWFSQPCGTACDDARMSSSICSAFAGSGHRTALSSVSERSYL